MLTKEVIIDLIQIDRDDHVHVRRARRVLDDGEIIGEQYHREVLTPGMDISNQPAKVQAICNLLWNK